MYKAYDKILWGGGFGFDPDLVEDKDDWLPRVLKRNLIVFF